MLLEFKYNYYLSFIYTNDLKYIYLENNNLDFSYYQLCKNKLNGIITEPKINEIDNITLSKELYKKYQIETNPNEWNLVINLLNIEKIWKFMVYTLVVKNELKNIKRYEVDKLPDNCFPYLKWLIPLSLDSLVHKSNFNQIIIN